MRTLDTALADLASELESGIDALVDRMVERLVAEPTLQRWTQPHLRELTRAIARENLLHEVRALRAGRTLPETIPPEAADGVRQAVELDAPVTVMLRCYQAGHAVLWEAWLAAVEASDRPAAERAGLLDAGSQFMFAYVDRLTAQVVEHYTQLHDEFRRTRDYRLLESVRRVLAGDDDEALGDYPVALSHLAVVGWGPSAEAVLHSVGGQNGSLIVPGGDATVWAWIAGAEPDRRLQQAFAEADPADAQFACGNAAPGIAGFRSSHHQAQDARAVALRLPPAAVTSYRSVALEALALADEGRARAFVAQELGSLVRDSPDARRLRTTLCSYFASEQNAATAAIELGVHERTVRHRLRKVETVLGVSPAARRAELEAALRFAVVLRCPFFSDSPVDPE